MNKYKLWSFCGLLCGSTLFFWVWGSVLNKIGNALFAVRGGCFVITHYSLVCNVSYTRLLKANCKLNKSHTSIKIPIFLKQQEGVCVCVMFHIECSKANCELNKSLTQNYV